MVKPEWSRADKPTTPWLLLAEPEPEPGINDTNHENSSLRKTFSISKNKCYEMMLPDISEKRCWGSSYGWIVMQDFNKNVKLFNPITKAELSLPSLYDLPAYSDYVPDQGYGSSDDEDGSSDNEGGSSDDEGDPVIKMIEEYPWAMKVLVRRFIVLKIPGSNSIDELVVFVIHYPWDSIAFARPGDKAWNELVDPWPRSPRPFIHQAMIWDGKVIILYCPISQSRDAAIAYCDIASIAANSNLVKAKDYITIPYNLCREPSLAQDIFFMAGEKYMVELAGDLLLVLRIREIGISDEQETDEVVYLWDSKHCYRTINFKVHKLVCDTTSSSWENVEDLDNYATAVHISKAPNCQKNAIYFIDDESRRYWAASCRTEVRGHDMGMFDMTSGKITSFYDGGDTISKYFSTLWFMPNF